MKSSDNEMPQSAPSNTMQPPARVSPSAKVNEYSMIGKSIVVKGEIAASDPLYIYGRVEGLINAPAHRVTIGKEGKVKADITAGRHARRDDCPLRRGRRHCPSTAAMRPIAR